MEVGKNESEARQDKIFVSFNESWMKYWESYVELQDQLYESLKAARDVSWLAATDQRRLSETNQIQRELFAAMPRRLDYIPLGQVSKDLIGAASKLDELDKVLAVELEKCKNLEAAIGVLRERARVTRQELLQP